MENLEDYKNDIINYVQSGYLSVKDILRKMSSINLNEVELESFVRKSFDDHNSSVETSKDVMVLKECFDEFAKEGYISLHKAGYSASSIFDVIDIVLDEVNFKPFGYIGYSEQDIYQAISCNELMISFGSFKDTEQTRNNGMTKEEIGHYFKTKLEEKGFKIVWFGEASKRLVLKEFNFINQFDNQDWSSSRCITILNNLNEMV